MKASPFESRKDQPVDPDLNAQIAAFFAKGGKIQQVGFIPPPPETPRFNGKNHEDIGKTYQQ